MANPGSRIAEGDLSPLAEINASYTQTVSDADLFIIAMSIPAVDRDIDPTGPAGADHRWWFREVGFGAWINITLGSGDIRLATVLALVDNRIVTEENQIAHPDDGGGSFTESMREFETDGSKEIGDIILDGDWSETQVGITVANAVLGRSYEFRVTFPPEFLNGNDFQIGDSQLTIFAPDPLASTGALTIDRGSSLTADRKSALTIDRESALTSDLRSALVIDRESALTVNLKPEALTVDSDSALIIDRRSALTVDRKSVLTVDRRSTLTIDRKSAITIDLKP